MQSFSTELQKIVVDSVLSANARMVSSVPQGSVLDHLLFLLYMSDLPVFLENIIVGYAADSTLLANVPEPGCRVQAVSFLNPIY